MKKTIATLLLLSAIVVSPLSAETEGSNDTTFTKVTELDEVTVISTRIGNSASLATKKVTAKDLQLTNTGTNLPYLLQNTPSLVVTSDDGLGIGYTYFRIRGTDHTRINMTVNGVPLNDSESQTVFWVNMTDMASSINSIDVQRGVGTSTNGAAAFGASINMQTNKSEQSPYAQISFNGGMYNTFREEAKIGTGVMPGGFAFDARVSKVDSKGFLERAFSNLFSYNTSAAWYGTNSMVKLIVFGGNERTYMAWDGVSAEDLETNRRYNPAGKYTDDNGNVAYYDNQTDNYQQNHVQLHATHTFNSHWNLNAALHYTKGGGYYEQYKEEAKFASYGLENYVDENGDKQKKSDLVRQKHLDNHFYGGVAAVNFKNSALQASLGGGVNNYNGQHFGNVLWLRNYPNPVEKDYEYYRNRGDKFDANIYIKANWEIFKGFNLYGDVQYRHIDYKIKGINDEDLQEMEINRKYNFVNPKAGISYVNNGHSTYFNFAIANREPGRSNFTESGINDVPLPERLYDYELGYQYLHKRFGIGVNLYFMDYYNQLVLTGQYSDVGACLTKNVARSYRTGAEITAGVEITKWLRWDLNATLSLNKIKDYSDFVDDWNADWDNPETVANGGQVKMEYGNTNISFSPNVMAGSNIQFNVKGFGANIMTNYVGKQYLDNTSNKNAMLNDYCVTNLRLAYTLKFNKIAKDITFNVQINNLFNTKYESNGGAYSYFEGGDKNGEFKAENQKYIPWYYAQAGINVHAGFTLNF